MRIALVCNRFAPSIGGVQTHVGELSKGLARRGHQVGVLTHVVHGTTEGVSSYEGVTVRRFRRSVALEHASLSRALVAHVRSSEYDVLHIHNYHDPLAAAALAVWRGPAVFTPHYHGESESPVRDLVHRIYRPVGRWMMRRSDRIICVSPAERDLVSGHFARSADRSLVISNGVHVDAIRNARPVPLDDDRRALVFAGRLADYKRVDLIIRSMPALRSQFKLYICGDGPDRHRLEGIVRELGLDTDVRLLGRVRIETLHGLLVSAAVVASASTLEAQGIVPLEGLAAGASVALSAIPAHRSIVDAFPGRAIMFGDDPAGIAQAIDEIASFGSQVDPGKGPVSWDEVVDRTVDVYLDVVSGRHGDHRGFPEPSVELSTSVGG